MGDNMQSLGVLVGVDESAQSMRALDWAVEQAAVAGRMLTVCHVLLYDLSDPPLADTIRAEMTERGRALLDIAVRRARQADRDLAVEGRLERGHVVGVLLTLAGAADEVVVASRGTGGFPRLRLGSVGSQLAGHAPCPVTVIGGAGPERPEVVVGVDGSFPGRAALDYGFQFAADHGLTVHAVHACTAAAPVPRVPYRTGPEPSAVRAAARGLVGDTLEPWRTKYPPVPVRTTVAVGHPAATLIGASVGARLLVVGSRGHGGFTGMLLGSVSQAVLRHATGPVTVTH